MRIWERDEDRPWLFHLSKDFSEHPEEIPGALEVLARKAKLADDDASDKDEPTTLCGAIGIVMIEVNRYSDVDATFRTYVKASELPYTTFVNLNLQIIRNNRLPCAEGVLEST